MPFLDIGGIDVFYGNIQALHGVSMAVEAGEIVTLLGANGAGKTSTLRTISGLLRPRHGRVALDGQVISGMRPHEIAALGVAHVPEGRRIFGQLTVAENLELGAFLRTSRAEIRESLDRVFALLPRLRERMGQVAGTLSGGEQQMLAIGRGLMTRPRILLLDEPSMGLAPVLVEQIFETIRDINSQGTTVLLVEQNAYMALQLASRGYVLQTGHVTLTGSADDLRNDAQVRKAYLGEAS